MNKKYNLPNLIVISTIFITITEDITTALLVLLFYLWILKDD